MFESVKLKKKSDKIESEVNTLKATVNTLQQDKLARDLIIRGVPNVDTDEDGLLTLTNLMLKKINCDKPYNISSIQRVGRNDVEQASKFRPILVQFEHETQKDNVLLAKKKVKLSCNEIEFEGKVLGSDAQVIYFDECLTKVNMDFFYHARMLRKKKLIKYAWTRSGTVFVKKDDGSKAVRITDMAQLRSFGKRRQNNSTPERESEIEQMELSEFDGGNDGPSDSEFQSPIGASQPNKLPRNNSGSRTGLQTRRGGRGKGKGK